MISGHRGWIIPVALSVGLLGWSPPAGAQSGGGQALVVRATVLGTTSVLSDTGVLPAGTSGALDASSEGASIPLLLSGDSLSAATIGSPDRIESEASMGSLEMSVAGTTISADLLTAGAREVSGAGGSGASEIDGLLVNGIPVPVTGAPNQIIPIAGGTIILNEQQVGSAGALINALHVVVSGVAEVVVASATAGTPPSDASSALPPVPGLL